MKRAGDVFQDPTDPQHSAAAASPASESPAQHIRNALQLLALTDCFKMPPIQVHENLLAVEARLMRALPKLEAEQK